MNKSKKIIIGVVLIVSIFYIFYQFSAPERKAEKERFVVNLKTSESEVITRLYSEGFIKNPLAFNLVLRFKGWKWKIKPGGYMISKSMSAFELADILVNYPHQKWVIIPEGLRGEEITEIVKNKLNWSDAQEKEFLENSKEGYLFPDTYLLNLDFSGKEVAQRMMSNFNEKVASLFIKAAANNIRNDTLVILASLVQREAANKKEMPLIAGIIWNRWLNDMRLEIDATVQYALGKKGNWWPIITSKDYKIDSLYNTYIYKGRPPAPICNPGLKAMEAIVFSEETDCLYYLHDRERKIHCAKTYEEHLENIDKYFTFPQIEKFLKEYLKDFTDYEILEISRAKNEENADFVAKVRFQNGKITNLYIVKENDRYKILEIFN